MPVDGDAKFVYPDTDQSILYIPWSNIEVVLPVVAVFKQIPNMFTEVSSSFIASDKSHCPLPFLKHSWPANRLVAAVSLGSAVPLKYPDCQLVAGSKVDTIPPMGIKSYEEVLALQPPNKTF